MHYRSVFLTATKEYFDIPLVRVPFEKVRFPRICPICGKDATKPARIITTPSRKRYLTTFWDPALHPVAGRRLRESQTPPKTLLLHVCEDHYQSDEGDTHYKLFCLICDGLLAAFFVFAMLIIGGNIWAGHIPDAIPVAVVGTFFLAMFITVWAFRAGPLAQSVKVIGFDLGEQNVWLQMKLDEYREAFMEENAMNAELVKWIVKASS